MTKKREGMHMGKQYKGIIFDLDGVICFTDKYHYQAWKMIADKLGVYFDETINNRLRGVGRMESLDIVLERCDKVLSDEEKVRLSEEKNEQYKALLRSMTPDDLSVEVKQTLDELREKGILLAIGSSSRNTGLILERIGLDGYFDAVSDGNNISRTKPDPEVFLCAAVMLGLAPWECLVVEDATAGIEAACAGGFDSAAIGDAACAKGWTYQIGHFSELAELAAGMDTHI